MNSLAFVPSVGGKLLKKKDCAVCEMEAYSEYSSVCFKEWMILWLPKESFQLKFIAKCRL